ncbi:MAG: hypothetical protein IT330_03545 [Anaerolineae bacterium]|nr:hypothetical protein [Anaerolineae bacterium]
MGHWTEDELAVLRRLTNTEKIQAFLDSLPYSADDFSRSPRSVLRDRRANCFDGALLAAAALRLLDLPPTVIDMRAVRDDDHVIAVFRRNGHLGAVAKSNFVGLRYREPIHRSTRELILSYFEPYYNLDGERSLRSYTAPVDLRKYDDLDWMFKDESVEVIAARLNVLRHYPLLTEEMIASLSKVDERSFRAGMLGTNEAGLYKPKR